MTSWKGDADRVAAFLKEMGSAEKEVTFSQISTSKTFVKQEVGQAAVNGVVPPPEWVDTDQVKS